MTLAVSFSLMLDKVQWIIYMHFCCPPSNSSMNILIHSSWVFCAYQVPDSSFALLMFHFIIIPWHINSRELKHINWFKRATQLGAHGTKSCCCMEHIWASATIHAYHGPLRPVRNRSPSILTHARDVKRRSNPRRTRTDGWDHTRSISTAKASLSTHRAPLLSGRTLTPAEGRTGVSPVPWVSPLSLPWMDRFAFYLFHCTSLFAHYRFFWRRLSGSFGWLSFGVWGLVVLIFAACCWSHCSFDGVSGAYKYVSELWRKKQSDVMRFLQRVRCWEYRQLPSIVRVTRPTRPDRARRLGYKAKQVDWRSIWPMILFFPESYRCHLHVSSLGFSWFCG